MLVRVNSGAQGVASYLETGRKRGREFDRDLIDERLVLDGDLALVDSLIDSIETAQEGDARYLHITLGLAESFTAADVCGPGEVNLAKLQAVTEAYREALMSAYDRSEYAWYAEAHVPKVTHELHEGTGEYVARLPHVHIVLPMRNLEDGRYLNPFGYGKSTLDYAQAIQEQINARFGLKSPQDSPRDAPINPVSKHNVNFAPGTPKELREAAWAIARDSQGLAFDQLAERMAAFGEVKIRAGKEGDYINVKPAWAERGINLKEFARPVFAATIAEARQAAPAGATNFAALEAEWRTRAALEARYVTRANFRHFKKLRAEERTAWLMDKAGATRTRLAEREREFGGPDPISQEREDDRANSRFEAAKQAWRAARLYQSRLEQAGRGELAGALSGVRQLSGIPLVHDPKGRAEVLLHKDAPDHLGEVRRSVDEMRRQGAGLVGDVGATGKGRASARPLTVAQTLTRARQRTEPDAERLKADTSPTIVLAAASRLYGLDLAKYDIGSGRDGTPRILHADKQYNLGDFFTKHLDIPWAQAKVVLTDCYHGTLSDGLPPPDAALWKSFGAWRNQAFEARRGGVAAARAKARAQLLAAREKYKRSKINAGKLPAAQRQAVLAKARADQLLAEEQARAVRLDKHLRIPSRNAQYREFLTDLAQRGNLSALGELRRCAPPDKETFDGVTGSNSKVVLPLPAYKVDHTGKVTYFKNEASIVADSAKGVAVLRREPTAYETALRVAVARYGRSLTLRGDKVFMDNMIDAARRSGMQLTIRDASRPRAAPLLLNSQEPRR